MNDIKRTPEQMLREYQEYLEFIQKELLADREKLAAAKSDCAPIEVVEHILSDIEKLEQGVDRYQKLINTLQQSTTYHAG